MNTGTNTMRLVRCLALLAGVGLQAAMARTWVVDDDGVQCPTRDFAVISVAVTAASPGDTIKVCPGNYFDNVVVLKTLTFLGARAGQSPFSGRTFGSASEATVTGTPALPVFDVRAANVTIDGFSLTNPGQDTGIIIRTAGDNAFVVNNIIDNIGGVGFSGNTQAIYLEHGPDNVKIVGNKISRIASGGISSSNGGVFIGDSVAVNPSLNTLISGNSIESVTSTTRGAYGIHVNNGSGLHTTANTGLIIVNNIIKNLSGGGWVHAIGLEADTPGVIVRQNCISGLSSPSPNRVAVWFEANPSFSSAQVNFNNFDVTPLSDYGIAVDPAIIGTGAVDGRNNWWNSNDGPGPIATGHGALVGPRVIYQPWLRERANGACQLNGGCRGTDGDGDVEGKNGGKAHFHMHHSNCDSEGEQEDFKDENSGHDFHSTQVNSVTYDDASHTVTIVGLGTDNGLPVAFSIVGADSSFVPPGLFSITLSNGYSNVGNLIDGSITLQ